jgi:hypothetical protein
LFTSPEILFPGHSIRTSFTLHLGRSLQRRDCRYEVIPSPELSSEDYGIDDQKFVVAITVPGAKWDAGESEHV